MPALSLVAAFGEFLDLRLNTGMSSGLRLVIRPLSTAKSRSSIWPKRQRMKRFYGFAKRYHCAVAWFQGLARIMLVKGSREGQTHKA